jgi:hypothetical protein
LKRAFSTIKASRHAIQNDNGGHTPDKGCNASVGTPVRADGNEFIDQAQPLLNGSRYGRNRGADRDAYRRGHDDEMRRQQAAGDPLRHL